MRVRSEERDEGKERQTFKVRCALTNAFYMFVNAHDSDEAELLALVEEHRVRTGSPLAARILGNWIAWRPRFVRVSPLPEAAE